MSYLKDIFKPHREDKKKRRKKNQQILRELGETLLKGGRIKHILEVYPSNAIPTHLKLSPKTS